MGMLKFIRKPGVPDTLLGRAIPRPPRAVSAPPIKPRKTSAAMWARIQKHWYIGDLAEAFIRECRDSGRKVKAFDFAQWASEPERAYRASANSEPKLIRLSDTQAKEILRLARIRLGIKPARKPK